ncbi:hypothetical protein C499_17829 [Halogeometricum borinquense DSM 11551]|uniref:Uncharacterized protein n=2 Tax=Halogeometricum borinquense TaxID=60847 RepID=E4NPL4_HALBP|nr:hypothetical protein Hbor_21200 [Halogeometricum borinquense DSM 11551]ELY23635.1 hypothetical protein C499_17829 [Halogeometricum borinquense DSM 11551]
MVEIELEDMSLLFRSILAGEDVRATARSLAISVGLLPLVFLAYEYYSQQTLVGAAFFPSPLGALVVFAAAIAAYRNRGGVAIISFGVFPPLGFALLSHLHVLHRPLTERLTLAATSSALIVGFVFACFGWAFGATARRLIGSMWEPRDQI